GGSGFTEVHQIDLTTGAITVRNDVPGSAYWRVTGNTMIHRSADGARFYFLEPNISSGPMFAYDATTNTFSSEVQTDTFTDTAGAAVNRNGTLIATRLQG